MVEFGKMLRDLRKKSGMTQQQLADRLWVSKATVSYYEQSLRVPSPETICKLAAIFHVSTDYLLGVEQKRVVIDVADLAPQQIDFLNKMIEFFRENPLKEVESDRRSDRENLDDYDDYDDPEY